MERGGRANLSVFNINGNNKLKKFHKKTLLFLQEKKINLGPKNLKISYPEKKPQNFFMETGKMDKTDQQSEIKKLVTSLLNNLNLEIEDEYINDNNILGSEIFYLEIFKEIFNN
jgi:hypothetical protein